MKVIYTGLEGTGKTLKLASVVQKLVKRNAAWLKKTGNVRPIVSNIAFSQAFKDYSLSLGIPIIEWENLDDLVKITNADVLIDEVGNYFDSRLWADLSLDVRKWLTQGSKCGIEIYGTAQDFAQVDISFRRLVNCLYQIRKLIGSGRPANTKPPIKRIWGICVLHELEPSAYDEKNKQFVGGWIPSSFFWIKRRDCSIFDTTQKIGRSVRPALRHEVMRCQKHEDAGGDGSCTFCKVVHI